MLEPAIWLLLVEWLVRVALSLRVVMRRLPVGTSLAWLSIILLVPIFGAFVYVLIGEKRLGFYRARWAQQLEEKFRAWRSHLTQYEFTDWDPNSDPAKLARLVNQAAASPVLAGNDLQLMDSPEDIFRSMINDIENANISCFLEYYIWEVGGLADEVGEALIKASQRGVECRILVDAVGSRGFMRSQQVQRFQAAGVTVRQALPANLLRAFLYRFDLRLHRKIAVIDHEIAYMGSQNMADPKRFQQGAGFGQWIDAMVKVRGPAVDVLLMTFQEDWLLASPGPNMKLDFPESIESPVPHGQCPVQVVPSGPGMTNRAIESSLLNAIYMADETLTLTSPYFVPDDTLQSALISAVQRGVEVTIILPEKVNSVFVRLANRTSLRELVEAGVKIALYQGGMLHTKSLVIDHDTGIFGSLNLDPRSLHLNFEITMLIYDAQFTQSLSDLQADYLRHSRPIEDHDLLPGSFPAQVVENVARLLAPLL